MGSGGPDDNDGQAGRLAYALRKAPGGTGQGHNTNYVPAISIGGNRQDDQQSQQLVYNPARTLQKDGTVTESFKPDRITDALHQPTGNKEPLVGGVRRLTPVECCRLQGFPDDWCGEPNEPPDSPRYAAMGDAVTVPVAEWLGRRLLEAP